jgi:hypothetical protein
VRREDDAYLPTLHAGMVGSPRSILVLSAR